MNGDMIRKHMNYTKSLNALKISHKQTVLFGSLIDKERIGNACGCVRSALGSVVQVTELLNPLNIASLLVLAMLHHLEDINP